MAIYRGDVKVSGNAMMVALPMFFATYQPRKLNNPSWLRAEPYSWHSADLYVSAYAHLADNISGVTAQTETIAGTTITYYRLSDEIKVVLPDQETNLDTIYNATGIGYYFVLDTTNRQFKLPRNIYGFTGYRGDVGGYVEESLPNITGTFYLPKRNYAVPGFSGAVYDTGRSAGYWAPSDQADSTIAGLDASRSSSAYQNNAPVQERATQAYLYFYVGNTVQNETSVDVAEMTEAINDKVDLSSSWGFPSSTYEDLTLVTHGSIVTAPADGYFILKLDNGVNGGVMGFQNTQTNLGYIIDIINVAATYVVTCPAKKGQQFYVFHHNSTPSLRFIYAQKNN